jgi:hypothetical protein
MRAHAAAIAGLALLLAAVDALYRWLHPEVNLARAALVGATAWLALAALSRLLPARLQVARGALAVFASAALSVLAIEAGWLVSRSPLSAGVHVAILAAAYLALARYGAASSEASSSRAPVSSGNASTSARA